MLTSEWKVCISTLCVLVAFPPITASPSPSQFLPVHQRRIPNPGSLSWHANPVTQKILYGIQEVTRPKVKVGWISSEGRAVRSWPSGGNPVCMQSLNVHSLQTRLHKNPINCRPNLQCLLLQTVWGSRFSASFAKVNFGHIRVDWLGVTLCRFSLEKTPQLCPKQYKQHGRQILGPPLENDFHTYKWMQLP